MVTTSQTQTEWVKILSKGMVTIPKSFRDALGIKEGEVARIKKVGKRLIIEARDTVDYEVYDDKEFKKILEEDKLPKNKAIEAQSIWSDLI
ncbi:hypothetical protein A3C23_02645 [Candidatus Roizmanbacteria bacterium RIFCSPHIGHO2_02_FULL_37_13b]|uniref:SpoVT-AbrB domain-containing protein n=1 Tax=Candidatus Roizmanbacteria bacterium RIFCSPLOWO2_02_FULL_36_11 TaxID=1802071 RepID=A0A1F7JG68_9BACT|nr:MAG: hypothetical protein A3C23_02645 [Candidatus Roizmanbacteria bacterium RIFCSPHIGHO2_02_FULL_37_13b]OGK54572.1 MAG: hypothetical protein A3H78_01655 [Candidatus Roizmanbacteria bacterium RIFCSPLOWO2_02_FULL_36_11]